MYLAGLIADDAQMTKKNLQRWIANATHEPLASFTVPWVAAGSPRGWELALEWIDSKKVLTAEAGWATLRSLVSIKDDSDLDLGGIETASGARTKEHSSGAKPRAFLDERICHCGRLLREIADGHCHPDGRKDRTSQRRHGQYLMSGSLCAGLHPKGKETRCHREEAQVGEMLNAETGFGAARSIKI